uniref:Methyltransf_21 domain-containing protein n=1 Tax=Steinernema glaseri TaxID=37863 RepID=A0A1I7Z6T7_9BILA
MDIEYAEYSLLGYFHKQGKLDQAGIAVCQWNCEFHNPDEALKRKFGDFLRRIVQERRYLPFCDLVWGRFFFVNVESPVCRERYVDGQLY